MNDIYKDIKKIFTADANAKSLYDTPEKRTQMVKKLIKEMGLKGGGEYSIWYRDSKGDRLVYDAELNDPDSKKLIRILNKESGGGFKREIMS